MRNITIISALVIASAVCFAEDTTHDLSFKATIIEAGAQKQLDKLKTEYDEKVQDIKKQEVKDLTKEANDEGRKGNLEIAVAVSQEAEKISKTLAAVGSSFTLVKVMYGTTSQFENCTKWVQSQLDNSTDGTAIISGHLIEMGTSDPAVNQEKTVTITYLDSLGNTKTKTTDMHTDIHLPILSAP
jgi:hypothetical protein